MVDRLCSLCSEKWPSIDARPLLSKMQEDKLKKLLDNFNRYASYSDNFREFEHRIASDGLLDMEPCLVDGCLQVHHNFYVRMQDDVMCGGSSPTSGESMLICMDDAPTPEWRDLIMLSYFLRCAGHTYGARKMYWSQNPILGEFLNATTDFYSLIRIGEPCTDKPCYKFNILTGLGTTAVCTLCEDFISIKTATRASYWIKLPTGLPYLRSHAFNVLIYTSGHYIYHDMFFAKECKVPIPRPWYAPRTFNHAHNIYTAIEEFLAD